MKTIAIIQARMSSERLPGKVLKDICGMPAIKRIVLRASVSENLNKIIIATSDSDNDDVLADYCVKEGFNVFRGSLNNVLQRFYLCATEERADIIVRLTGDNTLIDATVIDAAIDFFKKNEMDYIYYREGLPLGMAVEIFSYQALKKTYEMAQDRECIEHVTLFMYKNPELFKTFKVGMIGENDYSCLRWTMDTEEDYLLIKSIYKYMSKDLFGYEEVLEAYQKNSSWKELNSMIDQKGQEYKGEKICETV